MMDRAKLVGDLLRYEAEGIIRALAMTTYNPSIGRVLEKGGVDKFVDLMVEEVPLLAGLTTQVDFDVEHEVICHEIIASLKTARKEEISYGQAQKPVNVFLKVYVDWARKPSLEVAERLSPLLHVPLDSLLMKYLSKAFPEKYEAHILKVRKERVGDTAAKLAGQPELGVDPQDAARFLFKDEFSLASIDKRLYVAWQKWLRQICPERPVLLDTIWVLERTNLRRGRAAAATGPT